MDFNETIKGLNNTYPYWGLAGIGIGLVVGYIIGKIQSAKPEEPHTMVQPARVAPVRNLEETVQSVQTVETKAEEGYERRSIANAMSARDESTISGIITEFHLSIKGYSGIIKDDSGQAPFYIGEEDIDTVEEEGLVPILMQHALRTQATVEMEVSFNNDIKVFNVERMRYRMNEQDYEI